MIKSLPTKKLSDRVAERFSLKKSSASARNRATILALREDIMEAFDKGWKSKNVWETLFEEGKVKFSYPTFHSYVTKLIHSPITEKSSPVPNKSDKVEEKKPVSISHEIRGFTYNPVPNIEELI